MTTPPEKRLRILGFWGPSHFESLFTETYVNNPRFDVEIVNGDRSKKKSPHAASIGRLLDLRRRLKRGEFDLVLSGPMYNTAWPRNKGLATRLAQAFRFLTYKRGMLDSFWVPWLMRGLENKVPLAVTDTLDPSFIGAKELPLLKAATLYFKVNLYYWPRRSVAPLESFFGTRRIAIHVPKLRPLSFGIAKQSIPDKVRPMRERDIDICFTGSISPTRTANDIDPVAHLSHNPVRRDIFERCQKLGDRFKVYCINRVVPIEEYTELLQRSKLFISTESFGSETGRHWDISGAGAVPVVNWPYVQNHMQMVPDVHAIYFSLIGDHFEQMVTAALADPEKLERMALAAREFTYKYKEQTQIGNYVVDETLREFARLQAK